MKPLSAWARRAALLLHLVLVGGLVAWCGWLPGMLLSLPLLTALPGLLRGRTYTASWASMLVVFYVAGLLAEGVAMPGRRSVGTLLSTVAALDFVSLVLFVRLTGRELAARTGSSGAAAR
ncbi:MAG: DUF2069 domain-containing protein [Nevskia sp.]|nr:DUF2069 domain-containing protein [Nevskia sp.]